MSNMQISNNGLQHLITLEGGAQLSLYDDLGKGRGHCTIGVGHLVHKGVCNGLVKSEKPYLKGISLVTARSLLRKDLAISENAINNNIQVTLTQNQFDALVSFVFNVGPTAFYRSQLRKYIIQKDFKRAALEFGKWNKMTINGKKVVIAGLTNRRLAERALFEK